MVIKILDPELDPDPHRDLDPQPWLNAIDQQKIRRGGVAGVMRDWAGAPPAPPASVRSSRILPAKGTGTSFH